MIHTGNIMESGANFILFTGCSEVSEKGIARVGEEALKAAPGIDMFLGKSMIRWWQQSGNHGKPVDEFPSNFFYGIIAAMQAPKDDAPVIGFFQNRLRFHDLPSQEIIMMSLSCLARYYFSKPFETIALEHPGLIESTINESYEKLPGSVMIYRRSE